jgi:hypothetical protein
MPAHRLSPEKNPVRRPPSGKPAPYLSGRKTSGERRRPRLLWSHPSPAAALKNGQHEVRALDSTHANAVDRRIFYREKNEY